MASRRLTAAAKKSFMLIGQCVPCVKQNASKIKVKRLDLDTYINMYFRKDEFYYVTDLEKKCKVGDVILIKALPEKITTLITHEIVEIVHQYGDITDPVTGKKVVVGMYRDDIARDNELYGQVDSAFDYENAPPRGWQEGKKDFTDKETYIHYHEFPTKNPYAV